MLAIVQSITTKTNQELTKYLNNQAVSLDSQMYVQRKLE